jgi:ankyrin repeat protein
VDCTPLHWAATWGRAEIARLLLEHKADVNVQDRLGQTPLREAADCGHLGVIRLLLNNDAEINPRDKINATPPYWASTRSNGGPHPRVMQFLRAQGATE